MINANGREFDAAGEPVSDAAILARVQALAAHRTDGRRPLVVLFGGCSRSGKSTLVDWLAAQLRSGGATVATLQLDNWIVSVEKRRPGFTVLERYEVPAILAAVEQLIAGDIVRPPVYDLATRRRLREAGDTELSCAGGILLVEGVICLAVSELCSRADLRIYVDVDDDLRRRRLIDFHRDEKRIDLATAQRILAARECEEIPLIKSSSRRADLIYKADHLEVL